MNEQFPFCVRLLKENSEHFLPSPTQLIPPSHLRQLRQDETANRAGGSSGVQAAASGLTSWGLCGQEEL